MPTPTYDIISALAAYGFTVWNGAGEKPAGPVLVDMRAQVAKHATKTPSSRAMTGMKGIVLHHNAGLYKDPIEAAKADARYHVNGRDWPVVGYTFQIGIGGELLLLNDVDAASYAQGYTDRPGDENAEFMGVCWQGLMASSDYPDGQQPTAEQVHAYMALWLCCRDLWGWPREGLYGHFDFGKPGCPGRLGEVLINGIRDREKDDAAVDEDGATAGERVRGGKVGKQQQTLVDLGYDPGPVDDIPGPLFRAAVEVFQREHNLVVDGYWGPRTAAAINAAVRNQAIG